MNMQELAFRFAAIPAPSGFAAARLDAIEAEARVLGAETRRTNSGSLIVHRGGTGHRIALITHVDDGGFLATYREEGGGLRVNPLGTQDFTAAYGAPVVSTRGVRGVLTTEDGADLHALKAANLVIEPYGEAVTGDAFALYQPCENFGGSLVGAGLTASLSAVILLDVLADMDLSADLTLIFTGHHLLGARDAASAVQLAEPEMAVTLSAVPASGKLTRGGVVVSLQCGRAISDPAILAQLIASVDGEVQHDFAGPGVSDLGVIQKVGAGVPAAAIGYAAEGIGTLQERALLCDAIAVSAALKTFLIKG